MKGKSRVAVYAGSFDPLTVGHMWMIERGAALFDRLIVAVGVNPAKKSTFGGDERKSMLEASVKRLPNVTVEVFGHQFLIKYARRLGAEFILRGIRSAGDFEYERAMRNINGDLDSRIATVFLMPPRDIAEVSSSMVKGLIGPVGWKRIVRKYVPGPVFTRLLEKFDG